MVKRLFFVSLALLLTLSIIGLASAQSAQPTPTHNVVKMFSGSSGKTTDYFHVSGGEWVIRWAYEPIANLIDPSFAGFSVYVYPKGENAIYVDSIDKDGLTEKIGTEYVHLESGGDFYMKVLTANLDYWVISIEDVSQPTPTPTAPELTLPLLFIAILALSAGLIIVRKRKQPFF